MDELSQLLAGILYLDTLYLRLGDPRYRDFPWFAKGASVLCLSNLSPQWIHSDCFALLFVVDVD